MLLPVSARGKGRPAARNRPLAVVFVVVLTALGFLAWLNLVPSTRVGFREASSFTSASDSTSSDTYSATMAPEAFAEAEAAAATRSAADTAAVPAPSSLQSLVEEVPGGVTQGKDGNLYPPTFVPSQANTQPRVNAGFVVLVRNEELEDMKNSMRQGTQSDRRCPLE